MFAPLSCTGWFRSIGAVHLKSFFLVWRRIAWDEIFVANLEIVVLYVKHKTVA